jgi:protein O-GlcNAcase/histone acetyltransferase
MNDDFLGGVIEGFYGRPWTHSQRLTMIDQLKTWQLNTYFYAPKDDLKHRAAWRQPYDDAEIGRMEELARACRQNGVNFVYGISPGLDIRFSDPAELKILQQRLGQMSEIGVRHFALLFDDLPGDMSQQDRNEFSSVASAQVSVTNAIFDWLGEQRGDFRLLFCPTPYCDRMDRQALGGADYLDTIGRELVGEIEVFWTGPAIISEQIPAGSIDDLARRIGRKPVIWDNLHANDYDQRRLFCGPYSRSTELKNSVRGILSNPNNEFPINFIPLRTLGDYLSDHNYEPRAAYLAAAKAWSNDFTTINGQISTADIVLLADCHYLPFSDGDEARKLEACVVKLLGESTESWGDALTHFEAFHQRIVGLLENLSQLNDRELFYAWSRRIWDLREELDLISDFAKAKQTGKLDTGGYASESHLPSTYRGGFVANLQRQLKMNDLGRFETR